jgi:hypothetical protein
MNRSRWSNDPLTDKNGEPRVARIQERDMEIFQLLATYRYLPKNYICAFITGGNEGISERLELLTRLPNRFLNRPTEQRSSANANYRFMIYELAPRGFQELKKRGVSAIRPPATPFPHELMTCNIAASIALALKADPDLLYIPFDLRPIECRVDGTKRSILSDRHPFALGKEGSRKFYYGFEADTGSEQMKVKDGSSVGRKFLEYLQIIEDKVYKSVFNVRTFYIPFVFGTERRMKSAMKCLGELTDGGGSEYILFKYIPVFYSFEKPAPATGHIVTEPWKRVGHPDFSMAQ